jgi:hypothetical protein
VEIKPDNTQQDPTMLAEAAATRDQIRAILAEEMILSDNNLLFQH